MSELILYTTEDGRNQIKLRADQQQTGRLTQLEMAELDLAVIVMESLTVQERFV